MRQLTCGSLFAGIGGFDLGFERAGIKTIWQVEIDEYCRRVLARHFPDAERFGDIRECSHECLSPPDIISGGFPCQDLSTAGRRAGIDGNRSGLWREFSRIIGELRPRYVVVENVSAITSFGLGRVVGDLAAIWYDAEWQCIPASAVGAPHRRDRLWLVAYPNNARRQGTDLLQQWEPRTLRGGETMADTTSVRCEGPRVFKARRNQEMFDSRQAVDAFDGRLRHQWETEPAVGRVANGIPNRVDRVRTLGNAIVPQIAEWIGRRIIEAEERLTT